MNNKPFAIFALILLAVALGISFWELRDMFGLATDDMSAVVAANPALPPAPVAPKPEPVAAKPQAEIVYPLAAFPLARQTWSEALQTQAPASGFRVSYLDDGDLRRLKEPNPDTSGSIESAQMQLQEGLGTPDMEALAALWQHEPQRRIGEEIVRKIAVHYIYNEFRRIPSNDFAACWIGNLRLPKSGHYQFRVKQSWSGTRILVNRHTIYNGYRSEDIDVWLDAGDYLLEVEYANNWHTTHFSVALDLLHDAVSVSQDAVKNPHL
jgi:hypothetical protein